MSRNYTIPYNPNLKQKARQLMNSTLAEILLWLNLRNKSLGYEFHRQASIDQFIVDFYCHELCLVN
jgi:very-short-patch-repair endonuclease